MSLILVILFSLIDRFIFPNRDKIPVLFWWFDNWERDRKIYPIYRGLQFILSAAGFYLLWPNPIQLAAYLLAFVLMTTDLLFYIFEGGLPGMRFKEGEDTYWLKHFWQAGAYAFHNGFNFKWFIRISLLGLLFLIVSIFF